MPDDVTAPQPPLTPQPYPLWCVEASREHGARLGRIIGWVPTIPDETDGFGPMSIAVDYLPVLVFTDGRNGGLAGITPPLNDVEELFIGDDPAKLMEQAKAWVKAQGPAGGVS